MSSSSRAPAPIADVAPRAAVGAEAESATGPDAGVDADAAVGAEAEARETALAGWLLQQGSVLVGFSGGVDSAYLATLALEVLGATRMLAVIGRSASYPASQWATARAVADRFGIPVLEVDTDELNDPRYAANPVNRCYFCKTELWDRLAPIAVERGLAVVIDGTNADDLGDYRPGAAAAREHGVRSPMADVGLTKRDIRALSSRRGIPRGRSHRLPASRLACRTARRSPQRVWRRSSARRRRCARSVCPATCACDIMESSRASSWGQTNSPSGWSRRRRRAWRARCAARASRAWRSTCAAFARGRSTSSAA